MRTKLDEMEKTLRQLQSEKTEAETNALLAQSKLAAYKQNMKQQSMERETWDDATQKKFYSRFYSDNNHTLFLRDKEKMLDYMTEQANLARQVHELQ